MRALMRCLAESSRTTFHNLLHHRLPWRVEQDWTHEVTAADGAIICKCMTHERAMAVIALAEKLQKELDTPSTELPL